MGPAATCGLRRSRRNRFGKNIPMIAATVTPPPIPTTRHIATLGSLSQTRAKKATRRPQAIPSSAPVRVSRAIFRASIVQVGSLPGQLGPVEMGQERRDDAAREIAKQPGKSVTESQQGPRLLGFGHMNADELEQLIDSLRPFEVSQLLGVEVHIHQTDDPPLVVHDRKSQEA